MNILFFQFFKSHLFSISDTYLFPLCSLPQIRIPRNFFSSDLKLRIPRFVITASATTFFWKFIDVPYNLILFFLGIKKEIMRAFFKRCFLITVFKTSNLRLFYMYIYFLSATKKNLTYF